MRVAILLSACLVLASAGKFPGHPAVPLEKQVGIGRIVGGTVAKDGEFPWQVSLRALGGAGATHFCGASVIDKDWILTAAHCCAGQIPLTMHVVAGGIELLTFEEEEQTRNVREIIMHPNYDSNTISNDICLLHLSESLVWTDWVQPLALPEQGVETDAGTMCTVTGWGTTNENGGFLPNKLHKVEVPVVSDEDCNVSYEGTNPILDSMICAGLPEGGKDSCQGDSGGPFICGEAGSEQSIGIVSWGVGCARPGYPGVYTQTSYFVDWVMETMAYYA